MPQGADVNARGRAGLVCCRLCVLCCLAKIQRSSALAAAPHISAARLRALHIPATYLQAEVAPAWSTRAYPASWRLGRGPRARAAPLFRTLARMSGGAPSHLERWQTRMQAKAAQAEDEEISQDNFAQAKVPVISPDVSTYGTLLEEKAARVRELLGEHLTVPLHVEASEPLHYRMRAEFRIWHVGDDCHYAIFDPNTKKPIFLDGDPLYPLACERINEIMRELLHVFKDERMIAHKIFQVEFVASTSGEALVCLVYRKKLDEQWLEAAQRLASRLTGKDGQKCHVVGRSKGKKFLVGEDHVVQWQEVDGRTYPQWQTENRFSQSNARICNAMQHWVMGQLRGDSGRRQTDLLELYCGNGNFSLPLASIFRQVLATELDKYSVRAALACAATAGTDNLRLAFLSAAETAQALAKERVFRRLEDAGVDLASYDIQTILVDPPRAGLDAASLALTQQYDEVVYISCNPAKLRAELESFAESGHRIVSAALFDQFPWTDHAEVAVVMRR